MATRTSTAPFVRLGWTMLSLATASCTDVKLRPLNRQQPMSVLGTACTADPALAVFPSKIIFVVDTSGSNSDTDPNGRRVDAVESAVRTHISTPGVSFAYVGFADEAVEITPGFSRDASVLLGAATSQLGSANGYTNYFDALSTVADLIRRDALGTPEGQRSRLRYNVQFLSDGAPTRPDRCPDLATVEAWVRTLIDLKEELGLFEVRLSSILLDGGDSGDIPDGCNWDEEDYLAVMAEIGQGAFLRASAEELAFNIAFTEVARSFETRRFFLYNHARVLTNVLRPSDEGGASNRVAGTVLEPDSDQDGVFDDADSAPFQANPARDGCTDGVLRTLEPNEQLCQDLCANMEPGDQDLDGLVDCAEVALGTNPESTDTDRDGYSDYLEIVAGTNPLGPTTYLKDIDADGVSDGAEIERGTNPTEPEREDELAYNYAPLVPRDGGGDPGVNCFEFEIQNVRLAETEATETTERGENRLCVYHVQSQVDRTEEEPLVFRACADVFHDDINRQTDPQLKLNPSDFSPYLCPGAPCGPSL